MKTYDFNHNDVSNGFSPNYEYDFSDFYKTSDATQILQQFKQVIEVKK